MVCLYLHVALSQGRTVFPAGAERLQHHIARAAWAGRERAGSTAGQNLTRP
ncbi:Unknown protein sequence [Pseudomonas amygdali pv. lachrymans]|nr:Unknown protein sequence [Pseudomonas amygdali pv. lachrymans]